MILTHGANSIKRGGGEEPIPVSGLCLVNEWDFKNNNSLVDSVGKVTALQDYPRNPQFTEDGLDISYTSGCSLAHSCIGDYIEVIFKLSPYNNDNYHIRCLNLSSGSVIPDTDAFVIWHGGSSNLNWNTYFGIWQTGFSSNYDLFNTKKLGIHFKSENKFDIYVDGELFVSDRDFRRTYYRYAVGCTTSNFTSQTGMICEKVRIFRKYNEVNVGGKKYHSVMMPDSKEWLVENLDYKFPGCGIGGGGQPSTPNAWYYNNDETYADAPNNYGLLYNWPAIDYLEQNKSSLIPGWHVPSYDEWNGLITSIGGPSNGGIINGEFPLYSNPYGFNAKEGGDYNGTFNNIRNYGNFWTKTESDSSNAYDVTIQSPNLNISSKSKLNGYSVRLVKDS